MREHLSAMETMHAATTVTPARNNFSVAARVLAVAGIVACVVVIRTYPLAGVFIAAILCGSAELTGRCQLAQRVSSPGLSPHMV